MLGPGTLVGFVDGAFADAPDAPIVSSISPEFAETDGEFRGVAVAVTITGSNFTTATSAEIDGNALTSFVVVDDNTITGVVPAGTIGLCDVVVSGPGGPGTLSNGFEYVVDPADLTGIFAWFDAELGITESGGAISAWADQSGNGNDLSQSTAGLKPQYTAAAFGADHAVTFTPDDALALAAKHTHPAGYSWECVVKFTSADSTSTYGGDAPLTVFGDSTSGVYNGAGFSAGTARHMQYIGSWTATDGTTTTLNDDAPHHVVYTHSHDVGATVKVYVDGTLETSAAVNYNVAQNGVENIGSGYSHQDGFDGGVAQAIICDGVLSSTDVTNLYNRAKRVSGVA